MQSMFPYVSWCEWQEMKYPFISFPFVSLLFSWRVFKKKRKSFTTYTDFFSCQKTQSRWVSTPFSSPSFILLSNIDSCLLWFFSWIKTWRDCIKRKWVKQYIHGMTVGIFKREGWKTDMKNSCRSISFIQYSSSLESRHERGRGKEREKRREREKRKERCFQVTSLCMPSSSWIRQQQQCVVCRY